MSYIDIVICVGPLPILVTWLAIYRGQERTERDRLRVSQSSPHVYFRHIPCLTDFTFKFIRRPTPPILSPSYWTFVELTLVTYKHHNQIFGSLRIYFTHLCSVFKRLSRMNSSKSIHQIYCYNKKY
jgi:hypothetical protein